MKEVSWTLLDSLLMKLGWKNTFTQLKRLTPTVMKFPSGSSKVFSLSESEVDLSCVVIDDNVAQFFCDLNVSLCGGRERVLALSEDFIRYSEDQGQQNSKEVRREASVTFQTRRESD